MSTRRSWQKERIPSAEASGTERATGAQGNRAAQDNREPQGARNADPSHSAAQGNRGTRDTKVPPHSRPSVKKTQSAQREKPSARHGSAPLTARKCAMEVLLKCDGGQYSNLALDTALERSGLSPADRALTARLVYGVLERRLTLDCILSDLCRREPEPEAREALRLGLYQLLYLDRIPDHAAVDESVRLVPRRASGFVNATLRQFLRNGKRVPLPDESGEPLRFLSVSRSVPEPLVARLLDVYPYERVKSLLGAFLSPAPLTLRVNTLRTDRASLLDRLRRAGIDAVPCRYAETGITLPAGAGGALTSLPGFDEGLFFVQDEASQLCTAVLGARPGDTVADVCACPGSKSFGAVLDMKNEGRVFSSDLHESKLSLVRDGAERLGITCLEASAHDARKPNESLVGKCDRVLADVPCSGYGVLWKKPEIRYKHPDDTAGLPDVQLAIALAAAELVRPGGVLVYSTCTLLPEENGKNVARFLAVRPDFSAEGFVLGGTETGAPGMPDEVGTHAENDPSGNGERLNVPSGMLTLAPDTHGTDGFFIAKLRKSASS